jgi:hypothetical protein
MGRAYSNTPPGTAPAGSISNSELADMAQATVKGRAAAAGTGAPGDLTAVQLAAVVATANLSTSEAAAVRTALAAVGTQWTAGAFPSSGLLARLEQIEHFTSAGAGLAGFTSTTSGTGASSAGTTAPAGRIGMLDLSTGTDTTGRSVISSSTAGVLFGGGRHRMRCDAQVVNASDGTETFTVRVGYIDSSSAESADGAFFRYTHSVNGGEWEAVTRSNGSETAADTNVTVSAGNYRVFEIEVNAAGTSVAFYIDGALVATNSTNIPTGAGRNTGHGIGIFKSAGTTARSVLLDMIAWSFEPTTPL